MRLSVPTLSAAKAAVQQQRDEDDRHGEGKPEPLADGRELLVVQRHVARQMDGDAIFRREPEFDSASADEIGRPLAGSQRREIEHRLGLDEAAQIGRGRVPSRQQGLPRHRPERARRIEIVRDRVADRGQRRRQGRQRRIAVLHAQKRGAERVGQAAQARIGGDAADQPLVLDHRVRQALDVGDREQQQAVAIEERPAIGADDAGEQRVIGRHPGRERCGGAFGLFRRSPVDHHRDQVRVLRKLLVERNFALAPRKLFRQQPVGVGIDVELVGGDPSEQSCRQQRQDDHGAGMPPAPIDDSASQIADRCVMPFVGLLKGL